MLTCLVGDVDYAIKTAAANLWLFRWCLPSRFPMHAHFPAAAVRYNRYKCSAADLEYRAGIVFLHTRRQTLYKSRKRTVHTIPSALVEEKTAPLKTAAEAIKKQKLL